MIDRNFGGLIKSYIFEMPIPEAKYLMSRTIFKSILISIFILSGLVSFAQNVEAEKFLQLLNATTDDSVKFNCYIKLFSINSKIDIDKAATYLDEAEKIADTKESVYFRGTSLYNRGAYYNYKGKYDSTYALGKRAYELFEGTRFKKGAAMAIGCMTSGMGQQNAKKIEWLKKAESIYDEIKDTIGLLYVYNSISFNFTYLNRFDSALFYSNKELTLNTLQNNATNMCATLKQICNIYFEQHQYDRAIEYGFKALEYAVKSKSVSNEIWLNATIANIYYNEDDFTLSLDYYFRALKISESSGVKKWIPRIYLETAAVYLAKSDYSKAIEFYDKAKLVSTENKNNYYLMATYSGYADLYLQRKEYFNTLVNARSGMEMAYQLNAISNLPYLINLIGLSHFYLNNIDSALFYGTSAYNMSIKSGDTKHIHDAAELLSKVYEKTGDYKNALNYYITYTAIDDSTFNEEKTRIIRESESKYQTATKEKEIIRLNAEREIQELELERKRQQIKLQFAESKEQDANLIILSNENRIKDLELMKVSTHANEQQLKIVQKENELAIANSEMELKSLMEQKSRLIRNFSLVTVVLLLILGLLLFNRFKNQKQLENKQALLNERLRISRELHDDMGSTLSSISVYSDVAKNRANKNANTDEVLSKISFASRELIDKMSDIVWSLNPGTESIGQMKSRMMAFAAIMFSPNGIMFNFDVDESLNDVSLNPEKRKNIYLIYKEAVHNIIKYAQCKNVTIKIIKKEDSFVLTIKDDGIGFENHQNGNGANHNIGNSNGHNRIGGDGIKNMEVRAKDIHGKLCIVSALGQGTVIELEV